MIRPPPRSTPLYSSAASDVYKRQVLRRLKNAAGEHLEAPAAFRYYRDNVPSKQKAINARRGHFNEIFSLLQRSGIQRNDLYLAWDFTVASDANNTSRELAMRNDAFAQL